MKKIHCLNELANVVSRDTLVRPEPSREELDQKATLQSASFRELPSELWIEIYSFAPSLQDVSAMAQSCGLLYSVSQINLTWMPSVSHHFPKVQSFLSYLLILPPGLHRFSTKSRSREKILVKSTGKTYSLKTLSWFIHSYFFFLYSHFFFLYCVFS